MVGQTSSKNVTKPPKTTTIFTEKPTWSPTVASEVSLTEAPSETFRSKSPRKMNVPPWINGGVSGGPPKMVLSPSKIPLIYCQLGDYIYIYITYHLFWGNQKQPLIGGANDDKWLMLSFTLQRWVVQVLMLEATLAHGNPIELTGSGDLKYVSISPWNQGRLKMSHFAGNKNYNWVAYSHP